MMRATPTPSHRDHITHPVQLIQPDGRRVHDPQHWSLVADVGPDRLIEMYRDMVVARRIDSEATALQRQGELGLWAPLLGQEAAQVGSAKALDAADYVFTSYREHAVAYCRGVPVEDLTALWRGTAHAGWDPDRYNITNPAIIVGAQGLHATGYAMAARLDGAEIATIAYFGDGATSEGDISEALSFSVSFGAGVVFFCQNNQWAISEPVSLQSPLPLASRAAGFGMPALRVDGNDALAVLAVTREAAQRARTGGGPTFIEAMTYRMGPHTTSDDPTRYRADAERDVWAARDPLDRLELLLVREGALTPAVRAQITATADDVAARLRSATIAAVDPPASTLLDHVYAEPHAVIERQKSQRATAEQMEAVS
ncbi:MAG: pyruvate dehydrogenase (acetyl-transferring) E1 component subunit alpha [Rhodococcus sp. (in: high G+C Gram-positive bacteria)]